MGNSGTRSIMESTTGGSTITGNGLYVSGSSDDDESVEEISLDDRRFNSILGNQKKQPDFKSVWKAAQTPSTRLRISKSGTYSIGGSTIGASSTFLSDDEEADFDGFSDLGSDLTG